MPYSVKRQDFYRKYCERAADASYYERMSIKHENIGDQNGADEWYGLFKKASVESQDLLCELEKIEFEEMVRADSEKFFNEKVS